MQQPLDLRRTISQYVFQDLREDPGRPLSTLEIQCFHMDGDHHMQLMPPQQRLQRLQPSDSCHGNFTAHQVSTAGPGRMWETGNQ